jgi:3-methyladenine DNA glycosylase AlkD
MVIAKLRNEIARYDTPKNWLNYQRFFKERLKHPYGLKSSILRKISVECFRDIQQLTKADIFAYCDRLVESGERYHRFFGFEWAFKIKGRYAAGDFRRFESWLKEYVDNWGACDHLCCGALGHLIWQFPETVPKTKKWIPSKNRWLRRAAAVSLIVPVRHELLLDGIFDTADRLLRDTDDLVQKGYGWMLKEASNRFPDQVFVYVMKNKDDMPRTALRYAIEKLPPNRRKEAMKK